MYRGALISRINLALAVVFAAPGCDVAAKLTQCPTGTVDVGGRCNVACTADTDCVSGEACDANLGVCIAMTMPGPNPAVKVPAVQRFGASKLTVASGETVVLSWKVVDADTVEIKGLMAATTDLEGEYTTAPLTQDTTFELVARGETTAMSTVDIVVMVDMPSPDPVIDDFSSDAASIGPGDRATLSWSVTDAAKIEIVEDQLGVIYATAEASGSIQVMPAQTTTYRLDAFDANDDIVSDSLTITVVQAQGEPTIESFYASPAEVQPGDRADLEWRTRDADWLEIREQGRLIFSSRDAGEIAEGGFDVYPHQPTSYELIAGDAVDSDSVFVHVNVTTNMPPAGGPFVHRFEAWPMTWRGTSAQITVEWSVDMADSVTLYVDGAAVSGAPSSLSAMHTMYVTQSRMFELRANSNSGQTTSAWAPTQRLVNEAEPNNDRARAQPLSGDGIDGYISFPDDDWYSIEVPDGGFIFAETSDGNHGCAVDTKIEVYGGGRPGPIAVDESSGPFPCAALMPFSNFNVTNLAQGTYFIRVSAAPGQSGSYTLEVHSEFAECGNGSVEPSESCDDGNTFGGDGCSPQCMSENGGPGGPTPYNFNLNPAPYNLLSGSSAALTPMGTAAAEDEGYATLTMPFAFEFFGNRYQTVTVSTNGYVSFEAPDASWPAAVSMFPDGAAPNAVFAPFWADLKVETMDTAAPASIEYGSLQIGGKQAFIIQFSNLTGAGHSPASHVRLNAQVAFIEDGAFGVSYGQHSSVGGAIINAATGVEDPWAGWGMPIATCSPSCGLYPGGLPMNTRAEFSPPGH